MNHGPIHLHIDELVLDGFDPSQRHAIADALERELTGRLAGRIGRPEFAKSIHLERIDAGEFVVRTSGAAQVGSGIARILNVALAGPTEGAAKTIGRGGQT